MDALKTFSVSSWQERFSETVQTEMINALEKGQVLFFPQLSFLVNENETPIFSSDYINLKSKNISFNKLTGELRGIVSTISQANFELLHAFLFRFADHAHQLVHALFPHYKDALMTGRTSFRPVEVNNRISSYRKDDTRLHVDAFPANPNQGLRILRVFSNINPHGQSRVWRLGEPFELVTKQFFSKLKKPFPGSSALLHLLKITKKRRTLYDHYMLQLHDAMKADMDYQQQAQQEEFHFPPNSTWVVQTDHVSHAAMSGQYLLEQTFYLPVQAMIDPARSPLRVLEKLMQQSLV